jgi:ubiquinone/menaquinone biosynthesis C-methylase UbiE
MADPERIQSNITKCWNYASREYDAQAGHGLRTEEERAAWVEMLGGVLPPAPADVLDVGTGTGFMAFRAHELGHRVAGVDLSEEMLAIARSAAEGMPEAPVFLSGDAIAPLFPPESFDAVMNRHLLWTLTDVGRALRSWRALLRDRGVLVVVDGLWSDRAAKEDEEEREPHPGDQFYTNEVKNGLPMTHIQTVGGVVRLFEAAGFTGVRQIDMTRIDEAEGHLDHEKERYALVARR